MDGVITHPLAPGAATPGNDLLQFADANYRIQSVSVFNDSTLTIGFYFGAFQPTGNPDFIVRPGKAQTFPVRMSQQVAVGYSGSVQASGLVYIHYDDQPKPVSSSDVSGSSRAVNALYGTTGTGGQNVTNGSNVVCSLAILHIGSTPDASDFASAILISHLTLKVLGLAADTGFLIRCRNLRSGYVSPFTMGYVDEVNDDFAQPLLMYYYGMNGNGDLMNDPVQVEAVIANVPTITDAFYTVGLQLT